MVSTLSWRHGIIVMILALLLTACGIIGGSPQTGDELPPAPTVDPYATDVPPTAAPTVEGQQPATAEGTTEGEQEEAVSEPVPAVGFTQGAFEQAQLAAEHSQLAADALASGDLPGGQRHAEHVINIIVGEASNAGERFGVGFGDHNADGASENPGDGYGVWPYTDDALRQIDNTIEASDTGAETRDRLGEARICLVNLRDQETIVVAQAQLLLEAPSADVAQDIADIMLQSANAGTYGVDASGNTVVDLRPGECGAQQALEIVTEFAPALLELTAP